MHAFKVANSKIITVFFTMHVIDFVPHFLAIIDSYQILK